MAKAPQIAGFGQDGQGEHRPHAGQGLQALKVLMIVQSRGGRRFECCPSLASQLILLEQQPEHAHGLRAVSYTHLTLPTIYSV